MYQIQDMLKRKEGNVGHSLFDRHLGPSDAWFKRFQNRNPDLSWSVPQTIEKHRADAADERKIDSFFNLLGNVTLHALMYRINKCLQLLTTTLGDSLFHFQTWLNK